MAGGDDNELHRHRCEVRQVLAWRVVHGLDWVRAWLDDLPRHRSAAAVERLRADCREQWQRGNRGAVDDWR